MPVKPELSGYVQICPRKEQHEQGFWQSHRDLHNKKRTDQLVSAGHRRGSWNGILTYGGGTGYMTVAACPFADFALVEDVI